MKRTFVSTLVVGWFAAAGSGCLPIWTAKDMKKRISELEKRQEKTQKRLKKENQDLKKMIEEADSDVEELRNVLKEAKKLLQRNNADLGAELDATRQEIQKLRGEIERTQFRLQKTQQELQLFKEDVEMRFSSGGPSAELPEKADELFKFGEKKLQEGNLRAARQAFTTFKSKYSKDDRVDRVQVYLGDIHFREGKWVSAVVDYRKVLKQYPNSEHIAEATYKIGLGFTRMGKCDDAKPFFETVREEHGESAFANKSKEKLREIEQGKCR